MPAARGCKKPEQMEGRNSSLILLKSVAVTSNIVHNQQNTAFIPFHLFNKTFNLIIKFHSSHPGLGIKLTIDIKCWV
jgi:hypothetical protein